MRTKHWRTVWLIGLLLASGAQVTWAQYDPSGQGFPSGQYFVPANAGVPFGDPSIAPAYSGMDQVGYPPGANAWPNITPYGPSQDRFYTHNGFWFDRILSGKSKYFLTMEGLITATGAPPRKLIGAENVNTVINNFIAAPDPAHNQQFYENPVVSTTSPTRTSSLSGGTGTGTGGGTGTTGSTGQYDIPIFPTLDAGILPQQIGAGGVRGSWGWWNPDSSGFMLQAFWQDRGRSDVYFTDPPIIPDPVNYNFNLFTHLHPYFGLPLPGADRDGDGLPGVVVPYDTYVAFNYSTNTFGGNLDWYFSPVFERDYFKIRPLAGARYLVVNELFQFTGVDSGMGYTLSPAAAQTSSTSTGGTSSGTITTTSTSSLTFRDGLTSLVLIPTSFQVGFSSFDPIQSYLGSQTKGQFAGPETGFRVDLGGDKLKIWLQSKFGLMAYHSTRSVEGYNIGDHFNILTTDPTNSAGVNVNPVRAAGINGATFTDGNGNTVTLPGTAFRNATTTTKVSPMFEQGAFFQAPVLSYVPLINKIQAFEKAEFQFGYTVLVLGGVYRPTNDIDWAQYPNYPTVNNNKSTFYTTNWSIGVQWNY